MVQIDKDMQNRIHDLFDRLPVHVTADMPADITRFIQIRDQMNAAEEAERNARLGGPIPDTQALIAAQNAYDLAGEEFFNHAETLIDAGRMEDVFNWVDQQATQPINTAPADVVVEEQIIREQPVQAQSTTSSFNEISQPAPEPGNGQTTEPAAPESEKGWGEWARDALSATGTYITALPEVAWNNPAILVQSAENIIGSTIGLAGDIVDLADAGTRYAGWGSLKEGVGLDSETRYGELIRDNVVSTLDLITGVPEIRENSQDQLVLNGSEIVGEGALILASGGIYGAAKGGIRTASAVARHSIDDLTGAATKVALRQADEATPVLAGTTTSTLTNASMSSSAAVTRPTLDLAERSDMGLKNIFLRKATDTLDDAARAATHSADDVARAATHSADDIARTATASGAAPTTLAAQTGTAAAVGQSLVSTFQSAASSVGKFLTSATPRWVGMSALAGYVGYKVTDHETGGALTEKMFDGSIALIRTGIDNGLITRENIETHIDNAAYVMQVSQTLDKGAQTLYVRSRLGENPTEDSIQEAKNAALSWQVLPGNAVVLMAQHMTRRAVVDELYPDRDEADLHMARSLTDNLIYNAQVSSLSDTPVDENDVRNIVQQAMQSPQTHPELAHLLASDGGRLQNGFKQLWPELAAAPEMDPAANTTPASGFASQMNRLGDGLLAMGDRWQSNLTDFAVNLSNMPNLAWLAPVIGFIGALVGMVVDLFKGENVQAQSENPERISALGRTLGQDGATISRIDHNGQKADNVTVEADREHRHQPAPTPSFAPGS